ncbi:MAG: hypothetical protein WCV85_04390 [Patescibacteria group bacterium]
MQDHWAMLAVACFFLIVSGFMLGFAVRELRQTRYFTTRTFAALPFATCTLMNLALAVTFTHILIWGISDATKWVLTAYLGTALLHFALKLYQLKRSRV